MRNYAYYGVILFITTLIIPLIFNILNFESSTSTTLITILLLSSMMIVIVTWKQKEESNENKYDKYKLTQKILVNKTKEEAYKICIEWLQQNPSNIYYTQEFSELKAFRGILQGPIPTIPVTNINPFNWEKEIHIQIHENLENTVSILVGLMIPQDNALFDYQKYYQLFWGDDLRTLYDMLNVPINAELLRNLYPERIVNDFIFMETITVAFYTLFFIVIELVVFFYLSGIRRFGLMLVIGFIALILLSPMIWKYQLNKKKYVGLQLP